MKTLIICAVLALVLSTQAFGHSGRTDKKGGHKCSQKSIDKGLCTGYHYHNGISYANNAKGHDGHDNEHTHEAKVVISTEIKTEA